VFFSYRPSLKSMLMIGSVTMPRIIAEFSAATLPSTGNSGVGQISNRTSHIVEPLNPTFQN
jgi:hypothetical protein